MEDFIELLVVRPFTALIGGLEMLTQDLPLTVKMDAMISRAVQVLSRPANAHFQIIEHSGMNVAGRWASASGTQSSAPAECLKDSEE